MAAPASLPRWVLGITDSHCATACLLREGRVVGCVSEERFTRRKNEGGYPRRSVEWLLADAGLRGEGLDAVALAGYEAVSPAWFLRVTRDESYIDEYLGIAPDGAGDRIRRRLRRLGAKLGLLPEHPGKEPLSPSERVGEVALHLGIAPERVHLVEHHTAHAAAAYYASPFNRPEGPREAAVLTNDAAGDGVCATWNEAGPGGIRRLNASPSAAGSLGSFYSLITLYLGMRQLEHEYKVMGLAPYAPEWGWRKSYAVLSEMMELDLGDPPRFRWKVRKGRFRHLLDRLARHRFDWVAAAAQRLLEEWLEAWARAALERMGMRRAAASGGVFMNVKANQRLAELPELEEFYVLPSCGDESNAIGAAYWLYGQLSGRPPEPLGPLYLGPDCGDEEAEEALARSGARERHEVRRPPDIEEEVARLLAEGEVVARARGRMEFGARALGNRSILADPRDPRTVQLINKMIKSRDFWMPFAPTVLAERQGEYIRNPKGIPSPYMMFTFDTTPRGAELLAAATHPYDGTVRPQLLEEGWNPDYCRLLRAFERRTGLGAILNTSFNLHGDPIVRGAEDALRTFESSGLRHLALAGFLVSKRG